MILLNNCWIGVQQQSLNRSLIYYSRKIRYVSWHLSHFMGFGLIRPRMEHSIFHTEWELVWAARTYYGSWHLMVFDLTRPRIEPSIGHTRWEFVEPLWHIILTFYGLWFDTTTDRTLNRHTRWEFVGPLGHIIMTCYGLWIDTTTDRTLDRHTRW